MAAPAGADFRPPDVSWTGGHLAQPARWRVPHMRRVPPTTNARPRTSRNRTWLRQHRLSNRGPDPEAPTAEAATPTTTNPTSERPGRTTPVLSSTRCLVPRSPAPGSWCPRRVLDPQNALVGVITAAFDRAGQCQALSSARGMPTSPAHASPGMRPAPRRPRRSCRPDGWPRRRTTAGRPARRRAS